MNKPLTVRRGDVWAFTGNYGTIERDVKSVAGGVVSYVCAGKFRQCSLVTFARWTKGAQLTFATDWEDRNEQ